MNKTFFILLLCVLTASRINAAIRRVGFLATVQPVTGMDYLNFQAAHDASSPGDTIQLYPGNQGPAYTGIISKQLVITGPGYLTNSYYVTGSASYNQGYQKLPGYIGSCSFTIEKGSTGTIIQGLSNLTVTVSNLTTEDRNGITIRRCMNLQVNFPNTGICNNWVVSQCLNASIQQLAPSGSFTGNRTISNLTIENTVMVNTGLTLSSSPSGSYSNNTIVNCIFLAGASLSLNGTPLVVQNCIFNGQNFTGVSNASFLRNVTTLPATGNPLSSNAGSGNNQFNINLDNIFKAYPTNSNNETEDARFTLSPASSAKNAGMIPGTSTATDCGIFGGTNPYRLSGMPSMPVFFRFDSPSAVVANGASAYPLTISVTSY